MNMEKFLFRRLVGGYFIELNDFKDIDEYVRFRSVLNECSLLKRVSMVTCSWSTDFVDYVATC